MIQGSLNTMPLSDLILWIGGARKTGTLMVEGTEHTTRVIFRDGQIIFSSSTDPCSYFGQFLLAHTSLTEQDLHRAFERQEKTKVRLKRNIYIKTLLGKVLSEEELLSEGEIQRVLRLKTEETIYSAFLWTDGFFRFMPDELPPEELVPMALDPTTVVEKGRERHAEALEIRRHIPSARTIFRVQPDKVPADFKLSAHESQIVLLLADGKSLEEVMLELHLTEFATEQVVCGFINKGFVELDHELPPRSPLIDRPVATDSVKDLIEIGRESYDRGQYEDTVVAARRALRENPGAKQARELLELGERELTDSFYAKHFEPTDTPYLLASCGENDIEDLSAEEKFLLARINGVWDVGSLTKISPLKEVDTLACLKKLIDRRMIDVRRE